MVMLRHSDWHHMQTERGGTETKKKENWESDKGDERQRHTEK